MLTARSSGLLTVRSSVQAEPEAVTESPKYPPQQGFAWREGWEARLKALLEARGFESVTSFVASAPARSLVSLADELGTGDVAAIQLQWTLLEEAKASDSVEACARDLLVRLMHQHMPAGWTAKKDTEADVWPRVKATDSWTIWICCHHAAMVPRPADARVGEPLQPARRSTRHRSPSDRGFPRQCRDLLFLQLVRLHQRLVSA